MHAPEYSAHTALYGVSAFPMECLAIAEVVVFLFLCLSGVGWMVLSGS